MRRIFFFILALCVISFPVQAREIGEGIKMGAPVAENTTLASFTCNLSTVNGTAFISNPSTSLTKYINKKISISDGSKSAVGWIKAAGTGETFGIEKLTDPIFDDKTKWNVLEAGWDVTGGRAIGTAVASSNWIGETVVTTVGMLIKGVLVCDSFTGGAYYIGIDGGYVGDYFNSTGTKTRYKTITNGTSYHGIRSGGGLTATFSDMSIKQVLTPSVTGITIVSTQNGTTYNWASIESGFAPNTASFTVTISD